MTEAEQEDARFGAKVGDLIRKLRLEKNWSQEDLAVEARLHINHIGFIERSQRMPTIGVLRRIVHALGMRMSEFMTRIEE